MHNAVMCTLSPYDVIGNTCHLHIKLKSFSNIVEPLHKEAVRGCSFLSIIAKKSVIMSEAFLVDVSIYAGHLNNGYTCMGLHTDSSSLIHPVWSEWSLCHKWVP